MENEFPITLGFVYDEDSDEFTKPHLGGYIIIWKTLYSSNIWELSYVDEEDYQHFLGKGIESDIERNLLFHTRDSKINEILG